MRLSGWSLGIRASIENSANILACPSCVPRINASENTIGAILTYTVIFREKISQSGVFQQPARSIQASRVCLPGRRLRYSINFVAMNMTQGANGGGKLFLRSNEAVD